VSKRIHDDLISFSCPNQFRPSPGSSPRDDGRDLLWQARFHSVVGRLLNRTWSDLVSVYNLGGGELFVKCPIPMRMSPACVRGDMRGSVSLARLQPFARDLLDSAASKP